MFDGGTLGVIQKPLRRKQLRLPQGMVFELTLKPFTWYDPDPQPIGTIGQGTLRSECAAFAEDQRGLPGIRSNTGTTTKEGHHVRVTPTGKHSLFAV